MSATEILERIEEMKEKIEAARRERAKLEAIIDHEMDFIREKIGCKTLEEAKKKIKTLENKIAEAREKLERKVRRMEKELEDA